MIKTLVFDFGNVIGFFDHNRTSVRLAAHAELGVDAIHAFLFGSRLEADYETGRISTEDFLKCVRQTCRLRCTDDELATAWADIFWPNDAVIALLASLKPHYRLLLGSNTNELHSHQFCRQFAEALRSFDALVLSHEVGARKPMAAFFEYCQHLAGCAAEECLFIDDVPANVAGARACGWQGIVYTDVRALREELAALGIRLAGEPPPRLHLPQPPDL